MHNRHDCFQALLNFKNMIDAHDDSFLNSKKKYKTLAKKYHPDISKKDASLFQKLSHAYTTLVEFLSSKI